MYKMKADGVVFYDPSSDDTALHVLNPKAKYELNKVDSLTFTMLPDNVLYDGLHKMKSIITLEQDGEEIFRGRVLETTSDSYNQKQVYCEGELSYLLDSLVRPYNFEGKAKDLFRQLVEAHNEQVDEYKRFEVGIITAIDDETETETESEAYADTLAELRQMFVTKYDGYLRIRTEGDVRYLDYIEDYEDECGQAIEFGVNLVDIENKDDAGDVFSVLVPLGGYNTTSPHDPINIASVNDGKDYIEDAEAIAKYGRIVKTYKWEELTDPQEIMNKGLEHFAKMKANRTITIRAVDMHIIDTSVDAIRLGMKVKLLSSPHGLNEPEICSKIELNVEKPDLTEYTFGLPPETLTDNNASVNKKNTSNYNHMHRWMVETDEALNITVENVGQIGNKTTEIEADFNAAKAEIALKANQADVDSLGERVNSAEVRISGAESAIDLKASKTSVDEMGTRVTAAEVKIDGAVSAITLKADKVDLQAYVKMEDFEAVEGWTDFFASERIETPWLEGSTVNADKVIAPNVDADVVDAGALVVDGTTAKWTGGTVVTNFTVTQNKNNATVILSDGTTKWIQWVESVTITPTTAYIEYMGKN